MSKWTKLDVNPCYIKKETAKAYLISMPSRSGYDGYEFWHPKSLSYKSWTTMEPVIKFPDTWDFKLTANGGAIEKHLTAKELYDAVDEGSYLATWEKQSELHVPAKLDPIENPEPLAELIDND